MLFVPFSGLKGMEAMFVDQILPYSLGIAVHLLGKKNKHSPQQRWIYPVREQNKITLKTAKTCRYHVNQIGEPG